MKKFVIAAMTIAFALVSAQSFAKDWKKVRIGVEGAYPPFSSVAPDGSIVGFDIDIANALCEEMQVECTLVAQDWDGIIPALLARKYDAIIASMSITEDRLKKVDFSEKYYQTPARFAAKKGSFEEVNKETLDGKKVAVQRATTHDKYLSDNYDGVVEILRYATQDEALLDLTAGRVDLILGDSINISDGFLKKPQGKDFEFVGPALTNPKWFGYGAGIAIRKQDDELREKFNEAIDSLRESGKYDEIAAKYFEFDIFGEEIEQYPWEQ